MRPLRVCLTGGIGSGKSTVAGFLAQKGIAVIDADAISKSLTAPGGAGIERIREVFGDEFVDPQGGLNRALMRERVFSDPSAKRTLEALLHPLIAEQTNAQACIAESQSDILVFDVPLMVESGSWRSRVHRVIVVDCDEQTQVQRVSQRPGWSESLARDVIHQQADRRVRRACADIVIRNQDIDFAKLAETIHLAVQQLQLWACETITG